MKLNKAPYILQMMLMYTVKNIISSLEIKINWKSKLMRKVIGDI